MTRTLRFGVYGAVGCLLAAMLGELLLHFTRPPPATVPPPPPPRAVCLLIDCSASMGDTKLREVKQAAVRYARRQDLSNDRVAVVGFGTTTHVGTRLTHELRAVEQAIVDVSDGGTTSMDAALMTALDVLLRSRDDRHVLLFTDGEANVRTLAMSSARACREAGIGIVAVATGDADVGFLARITGDPGRVFWTMAGNYAEGFRQAEEVIHAPPTLAEVDAVPTDASPLHGVLRIGAWTALLALGTSLALVRGQQRRLRRRGPGWGRGLAAVLGSVVAGFAAGAVGQALFAAVSLRMADGLLPELAALPPEALEATGRVVAWVLLGTLLGRGMAVFVPNLPPGRALLAGMLGGLLGGEGFVLVAGQVGDVAGRLLGTPVLGFTIGLMIALAEVVGRRAWLEIDYGHNEVESVSLGAEPVVIGGDAGACTVLADGIPGKAFRYRLLDGRVVCEELPGRRTHLVRADEDHTIGDLKVTVRAARRDGGRSLVRT